MERNTFSNAIEDIKSRLDIVETVSEQVLLKKSGRNYWGLCPFHKEKTPSFSVNPEKGIFKCFGCGAGGDSISFIMKTNNFSFWETIVMLAQKYGIELPEAGVSQEKTELKSKILEINKEAVDYYKKLLIESPEAEQARKYLSKRSIDKDIIEKFGLGYAPNGYDNLIKHLSGKNYSSELMNKAGLVSEKSNGNGYVDRFRNRVIIPIQDEKGDYTAFGARALDDSQNPKYLNSPETMVFNKSRSLFAIHQAKEAIKENDSIILMEGFFDVITAHVHGVNNVVATLGTALTEQHIRIISRYTDSRKIYLAFDSDEAGINATSRGAEVIKSAFSGLGDIKYFDENFADSTVRSNRAICEIRVISSNKGKDPDEFIRTEGVGAFKQLIENAPLLIDYQINSLLSLKDVSKTPQEKADLSKKIISILSDINNSIVRNEYIRLVAEKLDIAEESLNIEVKKSLQKVTSEQRKKEDLLRVANKESQSVLAQKNLLSFYFLNNEKITPLCINNYLKGVNFIDPDYRLIKENIEKITEECNDPDQLFEDLLAEMADKEEAKRKLTDLIYCIEDKKDLNFELIEQYIKEHINYLEICEASELSDKLKRDYHKDNKDDDLAVQHQKKLIELIQQKTAGRK